MAEFTIRYRDAILATGGAITLGEDGISRVAGASVGLENFPEHKEGFREIIRGMIYDHFQNDEIAHETIEIHAQRMRTKMNLRMPYYNKLFASMELEFNPLWTTDMTTESEGESKSTGSSEQSSTNANTTKSKSEAFANEYPQTNITPTGQYATTGTQGVSQNEGLANGQSTGADLNEAEQSGKSRMTGYQGIPGDIIMAYRNSVLNVMQMLIDDLEPLFMGILDRSGSYFPFGNPYTF